MYVKIHRICVPTDFSEMADHAVHYGAALAHTHGAALHVLHVLEHAASLVHHPDFTSHGEVAREYFARLEAVESATETAAEIGTEETADESESAHQSSTHSFLKILEEGVNLKMAGLGAPWWENLEVRRVVRYGHPVEEICNYANKQAIDIIVMGTHGRSGISKLLMGSVAERTLRISPCPVLVIRHPDHAYTVVE